MLLHGLKIDEPISLGRGAYLADYSSVRRRFGLDEDPELWLKHRRPGLGYASRQAGGRVIALCPSAQGQFGVPP